MPGYRHASLRYEVGAASATRLEKVADFARKAVKLVEPYKPYGGQFLEFCSISLPTCQTCMKLTRKSTEFCQFFCRHYPQTLCAHLPPRHYRHGGGVAHAKFPKSWLCFSTQLHSRL